MVVSISALVVVDFLPELLRRVSSVDKTPIETLGEVSAIVCDWYVGCASDVRAVRSSALDGEVGCVNKHE